MPRAYASREVTVVGMVEVDVSNGTCNKSQPRRPASAGPYEVGDPARVVYNVARPDMEMVQSGHRLVGMTFAGLLMLVVLGGAIVRQAPR